MGIETEYNPDLALRNHSEFLKGNREEAECLPKKIEAEKCYDFLKKGQRLYLLHGEMPLLETKGNQQLSKPIASIVILEATHFLKNRESYTRGKYKAVEVFDPKDARIRFNGFAKVD